MKKVIVVNSKSDISLNDPRIEVVEADEYLKNAMHLGHTVRVFNLCRDFGYCKKGYYVSLIAEARGHRPVPSVATLMDLSSQTVTRSIAENFQSQMSKLFARIKGEKFELSIYFGQNLSERYNFLAKQIFSQFRAPLLRAYFFFKDDAWHLHRIKILSLKEIPDSHKDFLQAAMHSYFSKTLSGAKRKKAARYELAILVNPDEKMPPSNPGAIKKFISTAEDSRIHAEVITPKDISLIPRFDALFIRETTSVDNHTFRFARMAEEEGLIVIDDPSSILKCCNKIYLNYSLEKKGVPIPKTHIISRKNDLEQLKLSYPIVVKKPDSAFSLGVHKAESLEQLSAICKEYFRHTDLVILQEYLPTDYDWRVGMIDGDPLYACKYYMAKNHWQIINQNHGDPQEGEVEVVTLGDIPKGALKVALEASDAIGDGLYGIDIKETNGKFFVIEVNDNPNIDKGYEDRIAQNYLYRRIMDTFFKRLEMR